MLILFEQRVCELDKNASFTERNVVSNTRFKFDQFIKKYSREFFEK